MSTRSLTYQQSVFKRYHSDKHLSEFSPTRWRQKSTGIDMEQNYVTVTLCYSFRQRTGGRLGEHPLEWLWRNPLPGGVQSKVSGLRKTLPKFAAWQSRIGSSISTSQSINLFFENQRCKAIKYKYGDSRGSQIEKHIVHWTRRKLYIWKYKLQATVMLI